ncbi:MAG TPA: glutamine cyclotransferase, partial [Myxococcaceae bacterium]|nr:glutamine cyclotransferase [Myxococcaceae bacterium]
MAKKAQPAEIVREYGPFPGANHIHGVSFDGRSVWYGAGEALRSFDPATGESGRSLDVASDAGTAFDGK